MKNINPSDNADDIRKEYIRFGVNIQTLSSILLYDANVILKPFNLTFQQYNVLRILDRAGTDNITINYISKRMLDKNSNGSRLVDKLILKGWVEKKVSLSDKRTVNVSITEKGKKHLEAASETIEHKYLERMGHTISYEESKIVNTILGKTLSFNEFSYFLLK